MFDRRSASANALNTNSLSRECGRGLGRGPDRAA
jgi:hypothetical protein